MPKIGDSRSYVANYNHDGSRTTFTGGLRMGRTAAISINLNEPESNDKYYDNAIGETDGGSFTGGTVMATLGEVETPIAVMCFGVKIEPITVDGDTVTMRVYTDNPQVGYVGFGNIIKHVKEGVVSWQPLVLPKVKWSVPNIDVETQGETINYQDTEVNGRIFRSDEVRADGTYPWMFDAVVSTEELADKFIRTVLNMPIENIGSLTVATVPGAEEGNVAVTAAPTLTSGSHYMYRVGSNVTLPYYDQSCGTEDGFTAWDGTNEIAADGGYLLVVETDDKDLAKKAGIATVNAVQALSTFGKAFVDPAATAESVAAAVEAKTVDAASKISKK